MFVCGSNNDLYAWNQNTLNLNNVLKSNCTNPLSIVTLKNEMFAIGCASGQIEIWTSIPFKLNTTLFKLTCKFNNSCYIYALAMLPNGNLVSSLSSSPNYTLQIWNMTNFNLITDWNAHDSNIMCLTISPNDGSIISGSQDNTIKIWNQNDFTLIQVLKVFTSVFSVAILADGNLAAGINNNLNFWNMKSFQLISNLVSHSDIISALKTIPDGTLVSGSFDSTVKIWKNYALITTLNALNRISSILVLNNLKFLTSLQMNSVAIQVWERNINVSNINSLTTFGGHKDTILSLVFLNNTNWLASASRDMTIKIWSFNIGMQQPNLFQTLIGHSSDVTVLVNLPNMKLASGSMDKSILIWDIIQSFQNTLKLTTHLGGINSLISLKNEQNYLLSASKDVSTVLWNLNNDLVLKYQFEGQSLSIQDLVELDNGTLMSCSNDLNLFTWDYISNKSFSFKTNHNDYIYTILYVNKNNLVATGSKDLKIK